MNNTAKLEIMEHICTLSESDTGWKKEVYRVKWNDREKIDIRKWKDSTNQIGKGITLTLGEFERLKKAIIRREENHV